MGVGTGRRGKVTVTDMDTIETSNLSRQFLFRSTDVGNSKSISGARVVKEWNPDMNVEGIEKFVGPSTEKYRLFFLNLRNGGSRAYLSLNFPLLWLQLLY